MRSRAPALKFRRTAIDASNLARYRGWCRGHSGADHGRELSEYRGSRDETDIRMNTSLFPLFPLFIHRRIYDFANACEASRMRIDGPHQQICLFAAGRVSVRITIGSICRYLRRRGKLCSSRCPIRPNQTRAPTPLQGPLASLVCV